MKCYVACTSTITRHSRISSSSWSNVQLIHGRNGVGKTSCSRDSMSCGRLWLMDGRPKMLPRSRLTRWDRRTVQSFELEVDRNGGRYLYRLEIDHLVAERRSRVLKESLTFDGRPLFLDELGELRLFRDDHSGGATYSLNSFVSGLGTVPERPVNKKLTWFKDWLDRTYFLHLNPFAMKEEAKEDASRLDRYGVNFASWYRHMSQEMAEKVPAFLQGH